MFQEPSEKNPELHLININACYTPLLNKYLMFENIRNVHLQPQVKMVKELGKPRAKGFRKAELGGAIRSTIPEDSASGPSGQRVPNNASLVLFSHCTARSAVSDLLALPPSPTQSFSEDFELFFIFLIVRNDC